MSETKFTPGPWEFEKRGEHLVGSNGEDVKIWGCGLINSQRAEVSDANSSLIKSSPVLYSALENLTNAVNNPRSDYVALCNAASA